MLKALSKIILSLALIFGAYFLLTGEKPVSDAVMEEQTFQDIKRQETAQEGESLEQEDSSEVIEDTKEVEDNADVFVEEVEKETEDSIAGSVPITSFNLAVPFTSQAPHANWDFPYQEFCEEASLLMVSKYFSGVTGVIDANEADTELLDLQAFEEDYLGKYFDTTATETNSLLDAYFGISGTVIDDPTVEMIKEEILAGYPVIAFAAGRELDNPYFQGEGPLYHAFVIKGFEVDMFIVNDPGTRHGQNFTYSAENLFGALGDWNDGSPETGVPRVIFVRP